MGRPRAFDVNEALESALRVFLRKGYDGASLDDLTEAMGINRPSLYCAFGNKEELFRRALARYGESQGARLREAVAEPTARAVAERLLLTMADAQTDPAHPPGCLLVRGALTCGEEAAAIRDELDACRTSVEDMLRDRFERARSEGDLAPDDEPADLARYLMTITQGMAVQAAGGASRDDLRRVAITALRAFPAERRKGRR